MCVFPLTLLFEGALQLSTPKDSSMNLGNTPRTIEILEWLNNIGNSTQMIMQALEIKIPSVIGIHGILARVATETITMKDGRVSKLTTLTASTGPPHTDVTVKYWNAPPARVAKWEEMVHQAVNVTMVRCTISSTGNRFDAIDGLTKVTPCYNEDLEAWWLKPRE